MALIKSQLVLTDGMTGPLKSINKAMNIVLNSFEAMQDASGRAIDTASIQEAREELARASAARGAWGDGRGFFVILFQFDPAKTRKDNNHGRKKNR